MSLITPLRLIVLAIGIAFSATSPHLVWAAEEIAPPMFQDIAPPSLDFIDEPEVRDYSDLDSSKSGPISSKAAQGGCCDCGPKTLLSWNSCCCDDEVEEDWYAPLVTDRPDFTEASSTVGYGRKQIEMGWTYTNDDTNGTSQNVHSCPEFLLRMGVYAEWLEFRLGWNYNNGLARTGGVRTNLDSFEDLYLGFKIALTEQCGCLPEMALIPQMTAPLGDDLSADSVLPGLNWVYSWELSECSALGGSFQGNRAREDNGHDYTEFASSLAYGKSLSCQLGAYLEYFGLFPHSATGADTLPEQYLNTGLTWLAGNDLQYDVRVGWGLNDSADDFFVGTGLAYRF